MTPQPDFLRPVRGPHPLAWAACVIATLVLVVAMLDARSAWQALASAQTRPAPPLQGTSPGLRPTTALRRDSDAERALHQALARLQRPWPALFAALDTVQAPGVAWLALDIGEAGALRIEGLAPDAGAAAAVAAQLHGALPQGQALLGRLDAQPGGPQRFELSVQGWR